MTVENQKQNDALFYVLAGLCAAWCLTWIIGLLVNTH